MADNPWAGIQNLGAIDQKLYQQPKKEPPLPSPVKESQEVQTPPPALTQNVSKTANAQQTKSEKFEKYSTYLRPGYKKELKIIALEKDCKDYEVLDEAITQYLKNLKKK
jgi:hypothetical protein